MNEFLTYHLESAIALAVIYLFYRAFLRNETFFTLNRLVLLSSLPLAFILPLLNISVGSSAVSAAPQIFTMPVVNVAEVPVQASSESSASPLLYVYLTGVTLFLLHALYGFVSILWLKRKAKKQASDEGRIFLVDKGHSFSFFRIIFLSRKHHSLKDIEQIKAHEQVHVKEYHSIDALLIHLAIIFQWFNPFVWLLKYAIYENHEFIADRETSREVTDYKYQDLLLKQAAGIPLSTLVHPFNKLSLKRRFKMLLQNQSKKQNLFKYLLLLPVIGLLFWSISCSDDTKEVQQKDSEYWENINPEKLFNKVGLADSMIGKSYFYNVDSSVFTRADVQPKFKGGEKARLKYLSENTDYPKKAIKNNISGTVYVAFVIEKDGSVTNVRVIDGIGGGCDKEAFKVIQNMPDWKPAKFNGNPVKIQMVMPIKFTSGNSQKANKKSETRKKSAEAVVDVQPQFPGGEEARMQYLMNNIKYPQEARDESIEGTVYVQFIVEADGSITNAKVLRGIGGGCDEEALEVVENMPDWEPGKKDGEPVRTQFNMPIRFALSQDGE